MHPVRPFVIVLVSALVSAGCAGSVDPSDPDELSQVLVIPGAKRVSGSPPAPSSGGGPAPEISGGGSLEATSGDQAVLRLSYSSSSGYQNCYVQVRGASDYFDVPVGTGETSGEIQIPVNIPSSVASGGFNLYTCIAGANGSVSNPVDTSVAVTNTSNDPQPSPFSQCNAIGACESGGTLRSCVDSNFGSVQCWYEIGSRKFPCGSGCSCNAAAESAVRACNP